MHIAVAGNIGSGKTTLTKMLAKRYNWSPRFEPVEHNPYLDDFYRDMSRWSFNLQIYFLNKRFKGYNTGPHHFRRCLYLCAEPSWTRIHV